MSALHGAPWQLPCLDLSVFCSPFPSRAVLGVLGLVVLAGTEGEAVCDQGGLCHHLEHQRPFMLVFQGREGAGSCGLTGCRSRLSSHRLGTKRDFCVPPPQPLPWVSGASGWDNLSKSKAGTPQPAVCGEGRSSEQG